MEVSTVVKTLQSYDYRRDASAIRCRLYDLLMLSKNGVDIQAALPTVLKLLALPDVFVKRVAGEIMVIHCNKNLDIVLLAINTLVQDCEDLNPVIRGLSFRIIGNLSVNVISDVFTSSITKGLDDQNVYVRRTAALASIGLNKISSSTVLESDIWDLLYHHLRDDDSITVANCLCALEEICAGEKGVVVSNKMAQYLTKNIHSYNPTVQRLIIQFLTKFSPKTKSLMFECLNELDDHLSKSKSVVKTLCTLNLFCYLIGDLQLINQKVYKVAWSTISRILSGERSDELLCACIHFLNCTDFPVENVCQDVSKFLCHEYDPVHLINQKIKFLSKVINENNAEKIFGDYLSCIRTLGADSVRNLVASVANIANYKTKLRKACAHFLKQLIDSKKIEIVDAVIQMLPSISMAAAAVDDDDDDDVWKDLFSGVQANHSLITSMQARIALLQIIQSYPLRFSDTVDIFEEMWKIIESEENEQDSMDFSEKQKEITGKEKKIYDCFKISFLGAVTQAFLCYPAKCQPFLVRIMESCVQDSSSRRVREKGLFYYSYLVGKVQ